MDQPNTEQALRQLEPPAGELTFGATGPDGAPWPGGGVVTFQRPASGARLVERGTAELPETPDDVSFTATDGRQP